MMRLACAAALVVMVLVASSTAEPEFPPSVITNQDKIEWLAAEVDGAERALDSHMAKPLPEQNEYAYRAAILKSANVVLLSRTLAGGVPPVEARAQKVMDKASDGLARLLNSKLKIGMAADQVREIRGRPARISEVTTAAGVREQWEYDGTVLSFDNGKLVEIRQIRSAE
jgi:hypothetical protein